MPILIDPAASNKHRQFNRFALVVSEKNFSFGISGRYKPGSDVNYYNYE